MNCRRRARKVYINPCGIMYCVTASGPMQCRIIVELKEFMVHTSINTTIVYVTLAADALKDPAAKFGDYTVTKK